jgi:hypothetical protein
MVGEYTHRTVMRVHKASYRAGLVAQLGVKIRAWRNRIREKPNESAVNFFWNCDCAQHERATKRLDKELKS